MTTALLAYLSGVLGGFTTLVFIAKWSKPNRSQLLDDPATQLLKVRNDIGREQTEALQEISTALNELVTIYTRNSQ